MWPDCLFSFKAKRHHAAFVSKQFWFFNHKSSIVCKMLSFPWLIKMDCQLRYMMGLALSIRCCCYNPPCVGVLADASHIVSQTDKRPLFFVLRRCCWRSFSCIIEVLVCEGLSFSQKYAMALAYILITYEQEECALLCVRCYVIQRVDVAVKGFAEWCCMLCLARFTITLVFKGWTFHSTLLMCSWSSKRIHVL